MAFGRTGERMNVYVCILKDVRIYISNYGIGRMHCYMLLESHTRDITSAILPTVQVIEFMTTPWM